MQSRFVMRRWCWCVGVLLLGISRLAAAQLASNPFHVAVVPVANTPVAGAPLTLQVEITVPPDHYLYREATTLLFPAGVTVRAIRYPEPVPQEDPFLGKIVAVYPDTVLIDAEVVLATPQDALQAVVTYQGCSQSLCFRRMEVPVRWSLRMAGGGETSASSTGTGVARSVVATAAPAESPWARFLANPGADLLAHSVGVTYVLTFLGGILTSFTPCVLPMIPVILLIIGIQPGVWRRNLQLSTALALGVACTAALTGAIAAVVGLPLAFIFQQRWFVALLMLLFLLMALSMFGLFTLRLPHAFQQRLQHLGGRGPRGAFLAGISTGLLATPCAGPVVAALVAYVGVSGNVLYGFSLLLTYGLGFALIFILVGTFYGQLAGRLPHGGAVRIAKAVLGIFLLLPVGYYGWVLMGSSAGGSASGITANGWYTDPRSAYAAAESRERPVLIEFTAKSCPPCLVMEQTTFRDPAVRAALRDDIIPLRLDMTFPTPENLALADRYGVIGWPALLFVSPHGDIFRDLSLTGKIVSVPQLLDHITQAGARVRPEASGL